MDNRKYERHGERHTKLYRVWASMRQRCNNPNEKEYKNYGGRGISICPEWEFYANFSEWAHANGYEEGLTIERKDVNGNYCPENCTWIPLELQARNRTDTCWVEYNGKKMSLPEACELSGVPVYTFRNRVLNGWSEKDALSIKPQPAERSDLHKKAEEAGLNYWTVHSRIYQMGWSEEKALSTPAKSKSEKCEDYYNNTPLICPVCGKEFLRRGATHKYCSIQCYGKVKRQRIKERAIARNAERAKQQAATI